MNNGTLSLCACFTYSFGSYLISDEALPRMLCALIVISQAQVFLCECRIESWQKHYHDLASRLWRRQ